MTDANLDMNSFRDRARQSAAVIDVAQMSADRMTWSASNTSANRFGQCLDERHDSQRRNAWPVTQLPQASWRRLAERSLVLTSTQSSISESAIGTHSVPRIACSRSIASNSALKLPLPKLCDPRRWMISKNSVGRSATGLVKICSM